MKKEIKEIEPWGVNVPYIYLSTIMFFSGGVSLFLHIPLHAYLMTIGAYALYFGMIQRLFFPAKNYLVTHVIALILLAIPLSHYFQAAASLVLIVTEIWALKDVKSYGGKFPINVLVLSSPFLSFIFWLLFLNYWSLIIPLLVYILGVNIGVFTATLGAKPFFGEKQLPILVLALLTLFFKFLLPITLLLYFILLFYRRIRKLISITSLIVIGVSIAVTLSALVFHDYIHAFYLGVMSSFFFSCITYSTASYNHGKVGYAILLLIPAYFLRLVSVELSGIFFPIAFLIFLYLIKETLGIDGIKYGISKRFLEEQKLKSNSSKLDKVKN